MKISYLKRKKVKILNRVRKEIGCDKFISSRYTGKNIGVAVLDTGVYLHKDLRNNIVVFKDFVNDNNKPYDDNGHGTHICGIIGGNGFSSYGEYRGIAPDVKLICLKVLDEKGDGNTNDVLRALDFIIKNKDRYNIRIINISIGSIPKTNMGERTRLIQSVEKAWDHGLCVVVAAGNNGPAPMTVTTPGISRKVITVGSSDVEINTDKNMRKNISFSGCGPTPFCIVKPEVVAPGFEVNSCSNEGDYYAKKSGSSMSTAVVSGSIALLMEKYDRMTNAEVKLRLYERCVDINLPRNRQGWGKVNLHSLL